MNVINVPRVLCYLYYVMAFLFGWAWPKWLITLISLWLTLYLIIP